MNTLIEQALNAMDDSFEPYSQADKDWLKNNYRVFTMFCVIADRERRKGRLTGVRMVSNQIRWKTRIRDDSELYKVNNNHVSLMSHVYNEMPGRESFFATRHRTPLPNKLKLVGETA